MEAQTRARFQIRLVLVVYRAEMARLAALDLSPAVRVEWEDGLRNRSIELLDASLQSLDRSKPWHSPVIESIREARAEVSGDLPA